MCTAATYKTNDFYMGRTLDYEFSYGDEITVTPRNYSFTLRHGGKLENHYAIIGMAHVAGNYPRYYDAINEKGLGIAGLNFVGNATYKPVNPDSDKKQITQFELIPFILGTCASLKEAKEALNEADPDRSAASWALRWVGSHENVKVILSGMSSMEQLEDNLETFGKFQPLTEAEEEAVEKAADLIRSRVKNGCTSCRYCMPCPFGVNIPEMFSIWNNCAMFDEEEKAKKAYAEQKVQDASADLCKKCGACEKACPQGLSIRADLEKVAKELNTEEA